MLHRLMLSRIRLGRIELTMMRDRRKLMLRRPRVFMLKDSHMFMLRRPRVIMLMGTCMARPRKSGCRSGRGDAPRFFRYGKVRRLPFFRLAIGNVPKKRREHQMRKQRYPESPQKKPTQLLARRAVDYGAHRAFFSA